jgi:ubiquitin-protein ligase
MASATVVKRLMRESKMMNEQPICEFRAYPLEDNLLEWHFTLNGPPDSPYAEGYYHGRVLIPGNYPFAPPDVVMLTPNGRFELDKRICLSISSYHPETWQSTWGISTVLHALREFMLTPGNNGIGAIEYPKEQRVKFAKLSDGFECAVCGRAAKEDKALMVDCPKATDKERAVPNTPKTTPSVGPALPSTDVSPLMSRAATADDAADSPSSSKAIPMPPLVAASPSPVAPSVSPPRSPALTPAAATAATAGAATTSPGAPVAPAPIAPAAVTSPAAAAQPERLVQRTVAVDTVTAIAEAAEAARAAEAAAPKQKVDAAPTVVAVVPAAVAEPLVEVVTLAAPKAAAAPAPAIAEAPAAAVAEAAPAIAAAPAAALADAPEAPPAAPPANVAVVQQHGARVLEISAAFIDRMVYGCILVVLLVLLKKLVVDVPRPDRYEGQLFRMVMSFIVENGDLEY